ncbi:MAG TPA: protein kinase [Acidobacteriaceae bacterium]
MLRGKPPAGAIVSRFQPGEVLLDRFRIVRELGRGGMGEVYLADDLQLGRIALKALRPDIAGTPGAFERFRREVQLARKVGGPQVCRIHELFLLPATAHDPATAFLTMEYVDGLTLATRLAQGGPVGQQEALSIALDICEGLRLIHQQGIVHRDLKSPNVMLCTRDGAQRAIVMDFGLAFDGARTPSAPDETTISMAATAAGVIMGTPDYMSPERFEGSPVTAASDIYSLGVVLYQMLTRLLPYKADTPMAAAVRRAKRPPPVSSVQHMIPRHWDRVIARCLEYEPQDRFASADQVARALHISRWHPGNFSIDHPWFLRGAAALLVALTVWGATALWRDLQYNRPNVEGARWYHAGVASLQEGSYLRAKNELEDARRADDRFVMAHARLAEAWFDLDFDGAAQREMVVASEGEPYLSPHDRRYLKAIRSTVTRDVTGAVQQYRIILDGLPESEKSAGSVDLGMAYEREGDPQHALDSFRRASRINPDNPAALLQAAILETRLNRPQEANRDFDRAEEIYETEMNAEGRAELDYQRGYAANEREDDDQANFYLHRALNESEQLPSVQLRIKALTQLSSVAYNSVHDEQAVDLAQQAIRLAQDHQLNGWAADGLVRMANAQLDQGKYQPADDALAEASQILQQEQQDRVQALWNLTLASLRNQQQRPDDVIAPGQKARAWYRANGYVIEGAQAWLLLGRAQARIGNVAEALQTGNELLTLAQQAGKPRLITQAEELLGMIYRMEEDYPHALGHYQAALLSAGSGPYQPFEAVNCADMLSRVGRFEDSDRMLDSVSPPRLSAVGIRIESLLRQQKFGAAEVLASKTLAEKPDMPAGNAADFELDGVLAQAHGPRRAAAVAAFRRLLKRGSSSSSPADVASDQLTAATFYLAAGMPREAFEAAVKAEAYFESEGLRDSQLTSALIAMSAAKKLEDIPNHQKYSAKVVDIQSVLQQTWVLPIYQSYMSRPDIHSMAAN